VERGEGKGEAGLIPPARPATFWKKGRRLLSPSIERKEREAYTICGSKVVDPLSVEGKGPPSSPGRRRKKKGLLASSLKAEGSHAPGN